MMSPAAPESMKLIRSKSAVMDGFSFIEACQKEQLCSGVPIVVISAVQDALKRIEEVDVHACIAKPFDLDDLVRVVARYAHSSNGRNGHATAS